MNRKDLLDLESCTAEEITEILDTAESFAGVTEQTVKKVPLLRGKTIVNLFFEASTRTRTTFELAAKRLSADVLNINIAASAASVASVGSGASAVSGSAASSSCTLIWKPVAERLRVRVTTAASSLSSKSMTTSLKRLDRASASAMSRSSLTASSSPTAQSGICMPAAS